MHLPCIRTALTLGLLVTSGAVGGVLAACSGASAPEGTPASSTSSTESEGTSDGGGAPATATATASPTTCAESDLQVLFTPMYTAFDGVHTFQVPAVVNGVSSSAVHWAVSDPTVAKVDSDPTSGGVVITALKAGTVDVVASAGSLCGLSKLTVAAASADDWTTGNARYNDGIVLKLGPHGGDAGPDAASPQQAACTNCHGPTANGAFKDVAHTPEQTGGFSDDELTAIFRDGTVPTGGYFDPSIVPYARWQQFHKWTMTDDEARGIVVYLRSLTPTPQDGTGNFGGHWDGGHGGGGFGDGG